MTRRSHPRLVTRYNPFSMSIRDGRGRRSPPRHHPKLQVKTAHHIPHPMAGNTGGSRSASGRCRGFDVFGPRLLFHAGDRAQVDVPPFFAPFPEVDVSCHRSTEVWAACPTCLGDGPGAGSLPAQCIGSYPPARQGGNYMHNFYFPPAPSSTPWAPAWSPDGQVDRRGHERIDLAGRSGDGPGRRADATTRRITPRPTGRPTATGSSTRPTTAARRSNWRSSTWRRARRTRSPTTSSSTWIRSSRPTAAAWPTCRPGPAATSTSTCGRSATGSGRAKRSP